MKLALTFGLVALLSFCAGYFSKSTPEIKTEDPEVRAITVDSPIDQGCDDQLKKAEEYYGKAFVLFLANLGIRLSSQQKLQVDQLIADPNSYLSASDKKSKKDSQVFIDNKSPQPIDMVETKTFPKKELPYIEDEGLTKDTEKLVLKDPALTFARSNFIEDFRKIKKYNGLYTGKLYYIDGSKKGEVHNVDLNIDFKSLSKENNENSIEGRFKIKLSYNGHTYSNNNSQSWSWYVF
jgi:hypothetical protein